MENKKIFIQKLSDEQLDIVNSDENLLVTAIPGSGKTRVLTNKILNKLREKKDNKKIIAITYTRRATEEMKERIINHIGEFPEDVWIGTIHKFCLELIIRKFASFSKTLSKKFTVLGEQDMHELKEKLKKKYNIRQFIAVDFSLNKDGTPFDIRFKEMIEEYYKILLNNRQIDFDYILYESYNLLNNKLLSRNLANLIGAIYVDEYQDTHQLQYEILSKIINASPRKDIQLLFVGDENQAIYNSIGGICKSIDELNSIFQIKINEKHLTECYRSHQKVINFYKNFAVKNLDMNSVQDDYNNPECKIIFDMHKDNLQIEIAKIVRKVLKEGYKENDICIVAPQWHMLMNFSNKIHNELPECKFDSPAIVPLKKDEDNILYQISILILSTMSNNNIKRLKFIARDIKNQFKNEFDISLNLNENSFLNLINNVKKKFSNITTGTDYLSCILVEIFKELKIYNDFQENIEDFINKTLERINRYESQGIEDDRLFFERSLRSKEGIVISTAHGVKGEEYRIVIAFGLLRGYVPHWNDIFNFPKEAENRAKRLMFVIASRAKEKVYFIAERGRTTKNGYNYTPNYNLLELNYMD